MSGERRPVVLGIPIQEQSDHAARRHPAYDPSSNPPPRLSRSSVAPVAISGRGWSVSIPQAMVTAVLAVAGAWGANRATNEDAAVRDVRRLQLQADAAAAADREERKREMAAANARMDAIQTQTSSANVQLSELSKRITALEAQLAEINYWLGPRKPGP